MSGSSPLRNVGAVLPAAGSGTRFGGKKQLLKLQGKPLLLHAVESFALSESVGAVVIATPPEDIEAVEAWIDPLRSQFSIHFAVVQGGARRQDSVLNGLKALPQEEGIEYALVHDAARPLIVPEDIAKLVSAIENTGAAVLGFPSTDSVQQSDLASASEDSPKVHTTLDRDAVWLVQTPQGAILKNLIEAIEDANQAGFAGTDETSFLTRKGYSVELVEGPRENIKITYPGDLALAEFLLSQRK